MGGWASARGVPDAVTSSERKLRLVVEFLKRDTAGDWTASGGKIPFNLSWVGWQYVGGAVTRRRRTTRCACR